MTREQINRNRALWVEDLRSGKFEQTAGVLRLTEKYGGWTPGYCCLGVACERFAQTRVPGDGDAVGIMQYDGMTHMLPNSVVIALGLEDDDPTVRVVGGLALAAGVNDGDYTLAYLNDERNVEFSLIADIIEDQGEYWNGVSNA